MNNLKGNKELNFRKVRCKYTNQNCELRGGGVGKWASSAPMLSKKRPVRLLPLIAGTLDGASHPINPNPITLKSLRSQSLSKLLNPNIKHLHCISILFLKNKRQPPLSEFDQTNLSSCNLPRKLASWWAGLPQRIPCRHRRFHKSCKSIRHEPASRSLWLTIENASCLKIRNLKWGVLC